MTYEDFITISEAAKRIQKRDLSPVELIQSRLQRIAKYDGNLNSFIQVLSDQALHDAKIAEKEIISGQYKGPLHGIPIALKDVFEVADVATTCNSKIMQNYISSEDAHVVKRLKQAGAIIIGKLNLHEFSLGGPSDDLPWPVACNPWDRSCFAGGSSSGSGVALAAGFALGTTATDAGGSLRGPAALCGAAGIKPTYGLVGRSGIVPLSYSLDHAGPIAWTAHDCALLLQAMAGYDNEDPASVECAIPDYSAALSGNIQGLKVGLLRHFYTTDFKAKSTTIDAIDEAVKKLETMGCVVSEVQLSLLTDYTSCGTILMLSEGFTLHEKDLQQRFTDFGEVLRDRLLIGALFDRADYFEAIRRKKELTNELNHALTQFDVILTATTSGEAPKIESVEKFSILKNPLLTLPFNVTGHPAISVCCGFSETGLPLSMQIIGKHFDDATVLRVADAYERQTAWRDRRPQLNIGL